VTHGKENPWLRIPAQEYEGHMAGIGQSAALRDIFLGVYTDTNPRRLLVLGCTTGKDLELVDPNVTEKSVGVDLNRGYLEIACQRLERLGRTVELVHSDVLDAQLPASEFDLIHAALLVEYVDPFSLFRRIAEWLAMDGICSTVTQNPVEGVASVSKTAYESILVLDGRMSLCSPNQVNSFAVQAGLQRMSNCDVELPLGKSFSVSTFRKARAV
jgi:SAM-dependent methyltransferase